MSFSLSLGKALAKVKADKDKIARGTIQHVVSDIIIGTPVGDPTLWKSKPPKGYIGGTLRGAWNASVSSPNRSVTKSKDKNGQATIRKAEQIIGKFTIGTTFYLTNPQPHALPVEHGWSTIQRPQGMVRVAVANANKYLKAQAAKAKK